MPHLLFELGCEELPAGGIQRAQDQLVSEVSTRLAALGISFGEIHSACTPRRLLLGLDDVADAQPETIKDVRGPSLKAAYDGAGAPTKALEGFLKGQGAKLADVRVEADYVTVTVRAEGRNTTDVLGTLLPDAVRALVFDKTMRWGVGRMRFARPIRWILAAFGGEVVPFSLETVVSGLESQGHRFKHPEPFQATSFKELVQELRRRNVEPDPAIREQTIRNQAASVTTLSPDLPAGLVDENVFLTEWPTCHEGAFNESFMELPEAVIVTAMVKHERFFPVRDVSGKLTNRFISVRNSGDEAVVRASNEWVLNARLNDAKFFFDEDQTASLDDFLTKTERMVFQEGLGSVRQRADRLATLCQTIARDTQGSLEEQEHARIAGFYAKADLATGLVGELASLQGVVGGIYGKSAGLPENVCDAISNQYAPTAAAPVTPGARQTMRLALADQIDKLTGFVGTGILPTGSSDPYGLRRAATAVIETAWAWDSVGNTRPWISASAANYHHQGITIGEGLLGALAEIFQSRYDSLLSDLPPDVLKAAQSHADLLNPRLVRWRVDAAIMLKSQRELVQALSRAVNIAKSAELKGLATSGGEVGRLESEEAHVLNQVVDTAQITLSASVGRDVRVSVAALASLAHPTHRFFDTVMVMAEDEKVRTARLSLVTRLRDLIMSVSDISQFTYDAGS